MARPRGGNRRRFVLALVVLTSLTLITLDTRSGRTGALGSVGRVAHAVVSPVERATSAITRPIADWWSGVVDSGSLKRQNRKLREQVADLEGKQHAEEVARRQNEELQRLYDLHLLSNARRITVRVVNRDPGNFESTLTIDQGQEVHIEKDMVVVAADGVVGHVIDSWHGGAKVRVLTDGDSAIAVTPMNFPVVGIAQGREGSHDLVVDDYEVDARVKKGDAMVTAALTDSLYPPDLAVGTVTSVDRQPAGLGLIVHIVPFVDADALEFVDVLRWVPGKGRVVTTTTTTLPSASSSTSTSTSTSTSSSTPTTGTGP